MKLLEADKDGEYQPTSESPDMMEQLTISTVKKLEEKLEVSGCRHLTIDVAFALCSSG